MTNAMSSRFHLAGLFTRTEKAETYYKEKDLEAPPGLHSGSTCLGCTDGRGTNEQTMNQGRGYSTGNIP